VSTVLDRPATEPAPPEVASPRPVAVVAAVGRVEVRRMLRHPLTIVALLAGSWLFWQGISGELLSLPRAQVQMPLIVIPFAMVLFLLANAAETRARRNALEEYFASLPATATTRTAGLLAAVAIVAAGTLVVVALVTLALALAGGAGRVRAVEVLEPPAIVLLAGCAGIGLARVAPWIGVAPVALVGIAAWQIKWLSGGMWAGRSRWLAFFVNLPDSWLAVELMYRPIALHVGYLLSGAGLAAAIAIARRRRTPWRTGAVGAAAASGVVVTLLLMQPIPASFAAHQRNLTLGLPDDCTSESGVTYCWQPGYENWIDDWRRPVEGVLAAVPPEARPHDLVVEQHPPVPYPAAETPQARRMIDALKNGALDGRIIVGHRWSRGRPELSLALQVAARATGMPPTRHAPPDRGAPTCQVFDRARGITALWLAASATGDGAHEFRRILTDEQPWRTRSYEGPGGGWMEPPAYEFWTINYVQDSPTARVVNFGLRDGHYAGQLLERPRGEVAPLVARHWQTLTDPSTPARTAVRLLGLEELPSFEEVAGAAGGSDAFRPVDLPPCP
jgi:hypothetical protein